MQLPTITINNGQSASLTAPRPEADFLAEAELARQERLNRRLKRRIDVLTQENARLRALNALEQRLRSRERKLRYRLQDAVVGVLATASRRIEANNAAVLARPQEAIPEFLRDDPESEKIVGNGHGRARWWRFGRGA